MVIYHLVSHCYTTFPNENENRLHGRLFYFIFFLRYSAKLLPFHYANQRTLRDK